MLTRTQVGAPQAPKRTYTHSLLAQSLREAESIFSQIAIKKIRRRRNHAVSHLRQSHAQYLRLIRIVRDDSPNVIQIFERRHCSHLRYRRHGKCIPHASAIGQQFRRTQAISHAQSRQSMHLRKRSQHNHARALPKIFQRPGIFNFPPRRKVRRKFVISFVQHHHHMPRNLGDELVNCRGLEHRSSRIVRVRQKHDPRIFVDGLQDRAQIESILPHRSFDQLSP